MYARMCQVLSIKEIPSCPSSVPAKTVTFRTLLLRQCQQEFKKSVMIQLNFFQIIVSELKFDFVLFEQENTNEYFNETNELADLNRRRFLGNIR